MIDDGSTDGTEQRLRQAFGDRIRYVWQPNAGVSAARNHGLRLARGRYIAFLDSDDEWLPEKTDLQVQWLSTRPDYGMALCDVIRMDAHRKEFEIFRRRELLPCDGNILKWVLLHPAWVPASAMLRREVIDDIGGFDETLSTGEDLDFHLRVAARWKIGIVERPLVRAMRGHDGLSSLTRTYDDYVRVIERAVALAAGQVAESDLRRSLAQAYRRNARGMVYQRRWADAWHLAAKSWSNESGVKSRAQLLGLLPLAARRVVAGWRPGH